MADTVSIASSVSVKAFISFIFSPSSPLEKQVLGILDEFFSITELAALTMVCVDL